jgi:hypothetical protein
MRATQSQSLWLRADRNPPNKKSLMKMRDLRRNTIVALSGVVATVALGHLMVASNYLGFENPNPPLLAHLGPLWGLLVISIPLCIGYFATRFPVLQCVLVFLISSVILMPIDYAPAVFPGSWVLPLSSIPVFIRDTLVGVAIAGVLAYVGTWFRRRLNKRRERSRVSAP